MTLAWSHLAADIPEAGLDVARAADGPEREAIAAELGVPGCSLLEAAYRIRRTGAERYAMTGTVTARLELTCVVTLEPVEQLIEEEIEAEFGSASGGVSIDGAEDEELAALETDLESEPIVGGRLEAGRVIYQTVAAAVDPYPRKAGATFDWKDPRPEPGGAAASPFAALAKLKQR